jgi:hypothetical protein
MTVSSTSGLSCGCGVGTTGGTSASGFPAASTVDSLATNYGLIAAEEAMIQQAILSAASQCQPGGGQFCTTVGGNTPMTFVSGVGSITVNNGGLNYYQDTPMAVIVPPLGSSGAGAVLTLTTNGGSILTIGVTAGGSGYSPINATLAVSSVGGVGAVLQPLVNAAGNIVSINILTPGTGYLITDSIIATRAVAPNAGYVNANIVITGVSNTGAILSVAILNPGSGYQPSVATVAIVSTLNPSVPYPIGTGLVTNVFVNNTGNVTGVSVYNGGAGYGVLPPYLVITDAGTGAQTEVVLGTGATATSVAAINVVMAGENYDQMATGVVYNPITAQVAASATPIISGGGISGITGLIGGGYYTSAPTVVISGNGIGATATAIIAAGRVTGVTITAHGTGYTYASISFSPPTNPPNPTPAVVTINVPVNTFGTNANAYYQVWAGTQCNTALAGQLNAVISYFTQLGYTISLQTNPTTGTTLLWNICW